MTLTELFSAMTTAGIHLSAVGGKVTLTGKSTPEIQAGITEHERALCQALGLDPEKALHREGMQMDNRLSLVVGGTKSKTEDRDIVLAAADAIANIAGELGTVLSLDANAFSKEETASLAELLPALQRQIETVRIPPPAPAFVTSGPPEE